MHPVIHRVIDGTPARLRPAVDLIVRTGYDTFRDRVPGLAAEIAFFTLLSLPPLLLTLLSGVGFVGELVGRPEWPMELVREIEVAADLMLSDTGMDRFRELLSGNPETETPGLVNQTQGSLVGLGFLVTIISASRALRVVSTALTIAYDLRATRPAWQDRVWGIVLTLAGLTVATALGPIVVAGPEGGQALSNLLGGIPGLPDVWRLAYWPGAAAVLTVLIAALYHFAAPWRTPFRRDLPGALLAMVLWLLGTAALRVYVAQTIGESYGFIATPLVILLWIYVSAFVLLLGAEFNAEIEKKWPTHHQTDPASDPAAASDAPMVDDPEATRPLDR